MHDQQLIYRSFSAARMHTYETAVAATRSDTRPFDLYRWNMQISGAFMLPLHTCEVVVRNAVAEALLLRYGARWPWQESFRLGLPGGAARYNAREELRRAASASTSTASVVATLRFAFWQLLFTHRFEQSLWSKMLPRVLPCAEPATAATPLRARVHADLEQVRQLRNRIAHHEPIFARDLREDLGTIARLVGMRCTHTERWMSRHQRVSILLRQRPG